MISIEQVLLKLIEINKTGRASLLKRGVAVAEDSTTEEIMEKIGDIPVYKFSGTIKNETEISTKVFKHKIEEDIQSNNDSISVTTEISIEKGE